MVTVFTPSYNRAYIIKNLYDSLCRQTSNDFEWLIVDDGSTDNTKDLIDNFKKEKIININYYYVNNGGKASAINYGVKKANGNIFFIVDSDDYVTDDAIEKVNLWFNKIPSYSDIAFNVCGVCFRRENLAEKKNIFFPANISTFASSLELSFKYNIPGDKAEVFYTDVLRENPFPVIEHNSFIPEGVVWYRIAHQNYKFLIADEGIYKFEYIADGYTKNFNKTLRKNPKGFSLFYKECILYPEVPLLSKIKFLLRYLQCEVYRIGKK